MNNKINLIVLFFLGAVLTSVTLGAKDETTTINLIDEESASVTLTEESNSEGSETTSKKIDNTPDWIKDKIDAAKAKIESISPESFSFDYSQIDADAKVEVRKMAYIKQRENLENERKERVDFLERERDTLTRQKFADREQRDKDRLQQKMNAEEEKARLRSDLDKERSQIRTDRARERMELERQKEEERHQYELDLETQIQERERARQTLITEWAEKTELRRKQIENQRVLDAEREMEIARQNAIEDEQYRSRQAELDLEWANTIVKSSNDPGLVIPLEESLEQSSEIVLLDEQHEQIDIKEEIKQNVELVTNPHSAKEKLIEEVMTRKMNVREVSEDDVPNKEVKAEKKFHQHDQHESKKKK